MGAQKAPSPYLGIVEGKLICDHDLIIERRARMKILLLNPTEDLPLDKINNILNQMLSLYK